MSNGTNNGNRSSYLLPVFVIALLAFAFYSRQIVGAGSLFSMNFYHYLPWGAMASEHDLQQPMNPVLSDPLTSHLPTNYFVKKSVDNLTLPTWNPYLLGGYPAIAEGKFSFFYPLKWFFMAFNPSLAATLSAMLRIFLAGVFMFAYLEYIGIERKSSLFGATCFMFNGFFIAWHDFAMMIESAIWLPLIFLFIEKMHREGHWKHLLWLALSIAMSILAGMFQIALYSLYAGGVYALWRAFSKRDEIRTWKPYRLMMCFGLAIVIALLISAVQIVPFAELVTNSHRGTMELEREFFPMVAPVESIIQYVMPEFFGSHVTQDFWYKRMAQYLNRSLLQFPAGSLNLSELNGYGGVIPLLFALIGLGSKRRNLALCFLSIAILTRLPVFSKTMLTLYYYVVPGFKTAWAGRMTFIYMFSLSCLAALGFERVIDSAKEKDFEKKYRWVFKSYIYSGIFCILFLLVTGYLRNYDINSLTSVIVNTDWLPRRIIGYNVAVLASAFFWSHTVRTVVFFLGTITLFGLAFFLFQKRKLRSGAFAVLMTALTATELLYFHYRYHPFQKTEALFETRGIAYLRKNLGSYRIARFGNASLLPFNTALLFNLRDIHGYTSFMIDRTNDYLNSLEETAIRHERLVSAFRSPWALQSRLLDMLAVKYILTDKNTLLPQNKYRLVYDDEFRIFENRTVLARSFFVPGYAVRNDKKAVLTALSGSEADFKKVVLLEEEPDRPFPGNAGTGNVEIVQDTPNRVRINVEADSAGFLVLSDTYYPGWKVYVDGVEKKIFRANYLFRSIQLDKGHHDVLFVYKPFSLYIGAFASGISLLGVASLLAAGRLLSRSGTGHDMEGPMKGNEIDT